MKEKYDVVVIGGGIAGLVGGALLAKDGKKIAVLEKEHETGGYFSGYKTENNDIIDYAVSYILSCGKDDVVQQVLRKLNLDEEIKFNKLAVTDHIFLPDREVRFCSGKESFIDTLNKEFPEEKENIHKFVEWLTKFQEGTKVMGKEAGIFFMKYFKSTYEEFLNSFFTSKEIKGLLSIRIQADPASLMIMAGFLVECYFNGMYYPVGGAKALSDKLVGYIKNNGGDVYTNHEVTSIKVYDQKVKEIITKNGVSFQGDYILYNGDIIRLYKNYIGLDKINANIWNKTIKRKIGHSSLSIYLVVEGVDVSHLDGGRIYLTDSYDIFGIYRQIENGEIPKNLIIKLHIPTNHDKSLARGGRDIIRIETDLYHDSSSDRNREEYIKIADKILDKIDKRLLHGIKEHIKYQKIITPIDYEEKFLHTQGSGTGWAHTVENSMISTYKQDTPFLNLFIAGQWGEFSSGLRQIVISAEKSANLILNSYRKEK